MSVVLNIMKTIPKNIPTMTCFLQETVTKCHKNCNLCFVEHLHQFVFIKSRLDY